MSHDLQAAWAASEIAYVFNHNQDRIANGLGTPGGWSFYTSREGKREWPIADGVIVAENRTVAPLKIALEYKRLNEGLHGVLTALGQSLAYLEKGYNGSVIIIPKEYDSHKMPGEHLKRVLDKTAPNIPVSIYTYSEPDTSLTTPFRGKLHCIREISLTENSSRSESIDGYVKTLWAHLREGSSDPDAFYRYCQIAKRLTGNDADYNYPILPPELISAVDCLSQGSDPYKYLSYSVGDNFLDMTWRNFWFKYIVNDDTLPLYKLKNGVYSVNASPTKILKSDGTGFKMMNVGRSDSPKNKAIAKLNDGTFTEEDAWKFYAEKIRSRAHSYREDIDSGLAGIGFLTDDGRLTDLGYRFVDTCERTGNPNGGIALEIFGSSILQQGQLGAFLYYIYKLSEKKFGDNPLAFTTQRANGSYSFNQNDYKAWLEDSFRNELYIIRKVSERGGQSRQPFQAELAILRNMDYIKGFRIGVGLEINWPKVQESMSYFKTLV
jgi:hypothetical protein